MQEPLGTMDPLLPNRPPVSNLQAPSSSPQSHYVAAAAAAVAQWSDQSFVDEGLGLPTGLLGRRYRSPDDQLELLGQFEWDRGDHPEQQAQPWGGHDLLYSFAEQEIPLPTTEEQKSSAEQEPWSHLHTYDVPPSQQTHFVRLETDFSDASGIISADETFAWPANSPSDSTFAFPLGDGFADRAYGDMATAYNGANVTNAANIPYPPETYAFNLPPWQTSDSVPAGLADHHFANFGQVKGFQSMNDDIYQLTGHKPNHSTPYQPGSCYGCEAWKYVEAVSPIPTENLLSSPQDEVPVQSDWDEPDSFGREDPVMEYAGIRDPQSGAMKIEGNSERFQSGLASSFPPTAGFYPEYWPVHTRDESRNLDEARSRSFALRPASRRVNRKLSVSLTAPTLSVIHEDGKGGLALSNMNTMKGRRVGPLSKSKAAQARKNRKEKCVCIRCKMMKQSCSGEVPCRGCKENIGAKIWKSPCIKAEFLEMIEAGTCNYISQRSVNHLTLDQSRRVTMLLPETFNLTELLELLKPRRSSFNIHVRQLSGSLYTLDLAKCYDFLSGIHRGQESGTTFQLRDFIDNKLLKASDWLSCVKESCLENETLGLLAKWNNMPSRASYDIVSLTEAVSSRPLDVENPEDQTEILVAAQLSRIICRALEVAAFKFLHRELNKYTKGSKSDGHAENFVRDLGQLLLTLRWRISWWEIFGDGSAVRDDSRDRYVERVKTLTRVLYFYYCNAKKKLPPWLDPQTLKGVQSCYADAEPIFDDFPHEDSIDGFHDWMRHGQELIHEAGVQRRLSRC